MGNRWPRSLAVATIALALFLDAAFLDVGISGTAQTTSQDPVLLYNGLFSIAADELETLAAAPTPRTPEGRPDLTGYWGPPPDAPATVENAGPDTVSGGTRTLGLFDPLEAEQRLNRFANPQPENRPVYTRDYQVRVDDIQRSDDPVRRCQPLGVPRLGPPWEIAQTSTAVYFLYGDTAGTEGGHVRIISIDGRPHDPEVDAKPMGDSIGRWEGDTLVVQVSNLSDDTWLDSYESGGTIHSYRLRVVERLTRRGNTLEYQVTIEDPTALARPWVKPATTLIRTAGQHTRPAYPCIDRTLEHHQPPGR